MKHWYCIHTKPRSELVAEENLQSQKYEVYLPCIQRPKRRRGRWIELIEPLFPRYLFVHLAFGHDNIGPIRYTKGVQSLVRFTEQPAIVPDNIITALKHGADGDSGLHLSKAPLFKKSDTVLIDTGPLAGLEAIFLAESSEERVVLLLNMLGRENRVSIERDAVCPA